MAESIHARLDREAKRLQADQGDSVTRVSDSFIAGVEHAANIAYRMSAQVDPTVVIAPGVPVPDAARDTAPNPLAALHERLVKLNAELIAGGHDLKAEGVREAIAQLDDTIRALS